MRLELADHLGLLHLDVVQARQELEDAAEHAVVRLGVRLLQRVRQHVAVVTVEDVDLVHLPHVLAL